jgi:hypothetical protein
MNCISVRTECGLNDGLGPQIAVRGTRRSNADRAICKPSGQRVAIGFGHGEHGLDAKFSAGADDASRDLAAIGDQYAADGHG